MKVYVLTLWTQAGLEEIVDLYSSREQAEEAANYIVDYFKEQGDIWPTKEDCKIEEYEVV